MRTFLQALLVCPECKGDFETIVFSRNREEVIEGLLFCKTCGMAYPIVNTIPRVLGNGLELNPSFANRFSKELKALRINNPTSGMHRQNRLDRRTQQSFGFQWSRFPEMACNFKENFLYYIYPIKPEFFKGKIGLDAGCGFGRHIYNAAHFGAEMVGMDFSAAIDATYQNTKHFKNVHLIQADIYKIPFKNNIFDFIYSIGVLHHLSNPENGFRMLVPSIKPNGVFMVWVYSNKRRFSIFFLLNPSEV